MENVTLKKCSRCGLTLSTDSFNKRNASKDGLQSRCKKCNHKPKEHAKSLKFVGTSDVNATLSQFKLRDIISYLSSIGISGTLTHKQEIKVGK